jgi:hypothetical protein
VLTDPRAMRIFNLIKALSSGCMTEVFSTKLAETGPLQQRISTSVQMMMDVA